MLLVTHDMGNVQRFCDRAMLLERGEVRRARRARARRHPLPGAELRPRAEAEAEARPRAEPRRRPTRGSDDADAPRASRATATGAPRSRRLVRGRRRRARARPCRPASACTFCFRVRFNEDVVDPLFGVCLPTIRGRRSSRPPTSCDGPRALRRRATRRRADRVSNAASRPGATTRRPRSPRRQRRGVDRPPRALRLGRDRGAARRRGARRAVRADDEPCSTATREQQRLSAAGADGLRGRR